MNTRPFVCAAVMPRVPLHQRAVAILTDDDTAGIEPPPMTDAEEEAFARACDEGLALTRHEAMVRFGDLGDVMFALFRASGRDLP